MENPDIHIDEERYVSNYNLEVLLKRLNRKVSVIMWIQIGIVAVGIAFGILIVVAGLVLPDVLRAAKF